MADSIIPAYYFNTNLLCRWRFLLGGNVEANMSVDDVIEKALSSNASEPVEVPVLTRLGRDLHVLSRVRVLHEVGILSVATEAEVNPREVYGDSNYDYSPLEAKLSRAAVDGAIGAMVLGGIEDAVRGISYGKEYGEFVERNVPRGYTLFVNERPYFAFDAATYLLEAIMSVKLHRIRGGPHELFEDTNTEFSAPCGDCPFAEHCNVDLSGGKIWMRGDDIAYAVSAAMYLDSKYGMGWYLLYRTAIRLLNYRRYDLIRAFRTEARTLYGVDVGRSDEEDVKALVEEISRGERFSPELASQLGNYAGDFLRGNEVYIEDDGVVGNGPLLTLMKMGLLSALYVKKNPPGFWFFRIAPGPKFQRYLFNPGGDGE